MAFVSAVVLPARFGTARFWAAVFAAPALLGIGRLLLGSSFTLALELAAAGAIVLVLPGALIVRALGRPPSLGVAAAAALAWSLAVLFLALVVTFASEANLSLTLAVVILFIGAAVWPAATAAVSVEADRDERRVLLWVLGAAVVFAGLVWWVDGTISGDALFHLARVRKLETFQVLYSVRAANEFVDGGLHPGYAFPLWHGALALVSRIAGVDPALVVGHFAAVLVPLAFLVNYGAGRALFRSWAGGVAVLGAQVAQLGFARAGVGSFEFLALPATAARLLLAPAVLALAFALAQGGSWTLLPALAAAGAALALVHPTYALFLALPLGGFLLARLVLAPRDRRTLFRLAWSLPALVVPFGLYSLWIMPVLNSTIALTDKDRARALEHYASQLDVSGGHYRLAPEAIARGGAAVVAALVAVPLAALAAQRLWAAVVLGGALAVLVVVLVPQAFTAFSDEVSLSQGRRLAIFLPLSFALAGGMLLAGRFRRAGVAAALAAGIVLQVVYPGDFGYKVAGGGPGWAVWIAAFGGGAALLAGAWLRREGAEPTRWGALAALAFVIPVAVAGLAHLQRDDRPDPYALSPGLLRELRSIQPRRVIFANLETSYRIAAYATLYVAADPPAHVARTRLNHPYHRRLDVVRFFFRKDTTDAERMAILDKYIAHAVVVDKTRPYPAHFLGTLRKAYDDERYAVYLVHPPS